MYAAGPGFASLRTRRVGAHVVRMGLGMTAMALNFLAMIMLIGVLVAGRSDNDWLAPVRRWVLFSWLLLGVLIASLSNFTATNQLFHYPAFTISVPPS